MLIRIIIHQQNVSFRFQDYKNKNSAFRTQYDQTVPGWGKLSTFYSDSTLKRLINVSITRGYVQGWLVGFLYG